MLVHIFFPYIFSENIYRIQQSRLCKVERLVKAEVASFYTAFISVDNSTLH